MYTESIAVYTSVYKQSNKRNETNTTQKDIGEQKVTRTINVLRG